MANFFQLLNSISGLDVRVVSCSNRSHGGGLVASVGLGGVLKVRVRATRAIDADISSGGDVRASVGLAHDSYYSNPTGSSHWLGFK